MEKILRIIFGILFILLFITPSVNAYHGFLKDGDTYTSFDYPGATSTEFIDINNQGVILGRYNDSTGYHYFLKNGNNYTSIDYPGTRPYGINDAGQIVGQYSIGTYSGFLKNGNTYSTFNYPNAAQTTANSINNQGQIVGYYDLRDTHGGGYYLAGSYVKTGNVYTSVNYPGGQYTNATDLNDAGRIVGTYGSNPHGFLKIGDTYISFDYPGSYSTYPTSINNNGIIIGFFYSPNGEASFLKDGDEYILIKYPQPDHAIIGALTYVGGINDAGQIVGYYDPGIFVPEPSTYLLVCLSLVGVTALRRTLRK